MRWSNPARAEARKAVTAHSRKLVRLSRRVEKQAALGKRQEERLGALEAEVQELRKLSGRVAELADLVAETLATKSDSADPEFAERVARFRRSV